MKILALTHRLPYAPNRGDRIRSYHLLRVLARDAEVHLFSLADAAEHERAREMESWLASVTTAVPPAVRNKVRGAFSLVGRRPLTHVLLDAPNAQASVSALATKLQPDVVLAYCSGMARFVVDGPLAGVPYVLDMVDVDSAKWDTLARGAGVPLRWIYGREARVLSEFEIKACRRAATTLVVNDRERTTLERLAPGASITVMENGVDVGYFSPRSQPQTQPDLVFCGVMDYQPNIEGVVWFVERIWPLVKAAVPKARFTVVGAHPTADVRALSKTDGVTVTGAVDDVRPFLWRSAVSIAPLLTARGLQNKVLEALAAGLPVVTTPAVSQGLPECVSSGCRIASEPEPFARAIVDLLRMSPEERRAVSQSAELGSLSWEGRFGGLPGLMSAALRDAPA